MPALCIGCKERVLKGLHARTQSSDASSAISMIVARTKDERSTAAAQHSLGVSDQGLQAATIVKHRKVPVEYFAPGANKTAVDVMPRAV